MPTCPSRSEIALEPELRLPRFFVGGVGIRRNQRRGKLANAMLQVAIEGGGRVARDIHQRPGLVGVGTDQQRNIVLLP
jgi:hypothetical protein